MSTSEYPSNPNIIENIKGIPNLLSNLTNQYIVRPTGSPNVKGVSGFIFDIVGDEAITLESAITDHYVEDNYAIQDHIALRPEKFTLTGYVGELNDLFETGLLSILTKVQSIGTLGGLLPELSSQATQVYSKIASTIAKTGTAVNEARNLYDLVFNRGTFSTKQQRAYSYFYELWRNRMLCEIETPYGILENMAIESVQVRQGEESKLVSDFVLSFKKIRTAKTIQTARVAVRGKATNIITNSVTLGETSGITTPSNILRQVFV